MVALHLLTGRGTTTTAVTPPVFRSGGITEDNGWVVACPSQRAH